MIKNYILDTNVLLHDPQSIYKFEDNNVLIPIYVIEEIDKFKREVTERGRNARQIARFLDSHREEGLSLSEGVRLPNGGKLIVIFPTKESILEPRRNIPTDFAILQLSKEICDAYPDIPTVLVTMDINLRIRADVANIKVVGYESTKLDDDQLYEGWKELTVPIELIEDLYKGEDIEISKYLNIKTDKFYPNQGVLLVDSTNPKHTAIARLDKTRSFLKLIKIPSEGLMGIKPRNREQRFALDLLLDDDIKFVTLVGKAGTGKTLLALAAGLHKILKEEQTDKLKYQRLVVSRPVFPMGRDIGYLPGDVESKLNPWMQPIFDNIEIILQNKWGKVRSSDKPEAYNYHELVKMGILEIEPLTYIRGRSIPNQFIIVDEAQNLTPHEIKTIITRAGDFTKIVLTGDPYQIDNPYVDMTSNGLTYSAERLKELEITGHITLIKGERSQLAEAAANLL